MTSQNEGSVKCNCDWCKSQRFWKTARGDHMLTAAIVTSIGLTVIIAETVFSGMTGVGAMFWFGASMLS